MSIKAADLRNRFNGLHEIQGPKAAYDGWPSESVEEQRVKELTSIVGDIIIWIEEQHEEDLSARRLIRDAAEDLRKDRDAALK